MGMREECKHFQSRTYKSGEVARFCVLGNAPDQPWSCPENCLTYERRFVDVGWSHGTLVARPVESAPPDVPVEDRRELLASASEIVNAIAPELIEERRLELDELEKKKRKGGKFWRR
jgi:predicted outer membrane lipoprotein